jgi:hypothetical protein
VDRWPPSPKGAPEVASQAMRPCCDAWPAESSRRKTSRSRR